MLHFRNYYRWNRSLKCCRKNTVQQVTFVLYLMPLLIHFQMLLKNCVQMQVLFYVQTLKVASLNCNKGKYKGLSREESQSVDGLCLDEEADSENVRGNLSFA